MVLFNKKWLKSKICFALLIVLFFLFDFQTEFFFKKHLAGKYYLYYFCEAHLFYIHNGLQDDSGCGVFDGIVNKVGWNKNWIIAEVDKGRFYFPGLYILNVNTGEIVGSVSTNALAENTNWSNIEMKNCEELKRWYW